MAKFYFRNDQQKDTLLIIEPWAMAETVNAGDVVEFEVNDTPPPEIHFGVAEEGQGYVYVMSESVAIHLNGEVHKFQSPSRPPSQVFHVMRRHFWGTQDDS
jgi:hypothetical protein